MHVTSDQSSWWRHAVLYQIYPRSFADSDGDGVGDLPGIIEHLPYLRDLGVDGIWISPFYVSPMADAGYDVADYRDVDPLFGTLADADAFLTRAHELGLKVVVDLVPNHSSDEHAWFQAALAAAPGSRERARYLFRDGQGVDGELPPNNWQSVFGGPAWTRVMEADGRPGQWYLHLFDAKQPDFDWENEEVRAEFHAILRFWLDRGVDGFRVDVAHSLVKQAGLPDWDEPQHLLGDTDDPLVHTGNVASVRPPMWDQDGVHEVYRAWRSILNEYNVAGDADADRVLCAEAWVEPPSRAVRYIRGDEMHQSFNFDFLMAAWRADRLREVIELSYRWCDSVGAPATWVLSNHDVVRHASRLGLPIGTRRPNGIGIGDPQPDAELGLRRARAATALMLALPGAAYLYQGEELGLPEHTELPDEVRQDPAWERNGHTERGRDGCRIPFPWTADGPSLGFGPTANAWLPQPDSYAGLAADTQAGAEGSTLELYRRLLALRAEHRLGVGSLHWLDGYGEDVVALGNLDLDRRPVGVVVNLGPASVPLPPQAVVLAASGPLDQGRVPTDTGVWFLA
ncbi:MAG TPA: glycoside hydrolase family 13 protein [Dermatophilaceae bacterium]|nr:glycoside hydrolase family 13 protein [Dermatophilaceae bacterium]